MNNTLLGRILLGAILIVVVVAIVVGLANLIGGGGEEADTAEDVPSLLEFDNQNSSVQFMGSGEIEGRENFHTQRITVSADERLFEIIEGYDGNVIESQRYDNDLSAYRVFLRALSFEGFDQTQPGTSTFDDERGVCPTGKRNVFILFENDSEVFRTWRASCGRDLGTFAGDYRTIEELFENQINDHRELTRGFRF